jgi:putative transposase
MPRKNSLKIYVQDGYYHIYNRGVEKRTIFEDEQDYKVFLSYLKYSLSEPPKKMDIAKIFTLQGSPFKGVPRMPKNFHNKIELLAFCLMPNHFHLLLKQCDNDSLKSFMMSLVTRYSMYFNKKNDRVGSLFQSIYKAILITDEPYLLHISRYIHLNPAEFANDLTSAYSSYADYLGLRHTSWINPDVILEQFNNKVGIEFKKINSYKDFVEKYQQEDKLVLGNLAID